MGHIYNDYKEISFTDTETNYVIGTEAGTDFRAETIMFQPDQNCKVRFNSSTGVQHYINQNDYVSFDQKTVKIFVVRDTTNGTLKVWAEGDIQI